MKSNVNLKEMPIKKKIEYIWDYYKIAILAIIFAIYTLTSALYNYFTQKDCLINMIMVNSSIPYDGAVFASDFLEAEGLDPNTQEIVISSVKLGMTQSSYQQDYYMVQSLIARLTSGSIQLFSAPSDIFSSYAAEGYFLDLNTIFTKDELSAFENLLIYTTAPDTLKSYPCAFDLSDNPWITQSSYYSDSCHFGILYNCTDVDIVKKFLLYILNYSPHSCESG